MNTKGFTLIELMIVISIIATLVASGFFPYAYYMRRAHVEKTTDMLAQEWIVAHQDIRNGLLYDEASHAHMEIEMKKWEQNISLFVSSGSSASRKPYKTISLEDVVILGFSGAAEWKNKVIYHISPPFATGAYSIEDTPNIAISTGIILEVGYPGSSGIPGKSRNILLRPYYN